MTRSDPQRGRSAGRGRVHAAASGRASAFDIDGPEHAQPYGHRSRLCNLRVTKIDRLGCDAVDIQQTVTQLKVLGVRVFVTQLGATDLTNSAGKMLLAMLAAFAEMERDLIGERTQAGLARARAQGGASAGYRRRARTTAQRSARDWSPSVPWRAPTLSVGRQ